MSITETDQLDETKPCNYCKSNENTIVIDGRFGKIVRCNQCGLMYRTTMVGVHPLKFYGDSDHLKKQIDIKQAIQLSDYEKSFAVIEKYINPNQPDCSLLEIGSYHGSFLNLASKRGYQVTGLEPDPILAEHSRKKFDFNIIDGFLSDAKFPDESFDVVVMFHVIEHMNYPLEELAEINRILKKGGLLVAETPRYDTIWFKVLKERERSVIPEHFFFFTRKSLTEMVTKAGFSVLQLDNVGRTLTLDRLFGNVSKVLASKILNNVLHKISVFFRLEKVKLHINIGDMMRVYGQKS